MVVVFLEITKGEVRRRIKERENSKKDTRKESVNYKLRMTECKTMRERRENSKKGT